MTGDRISGKKLPKLHHLQKKTQFIAGYNSQKYQADATAMALQGISIISDAPTTQHQKTTQAERAEKKRIRDALYREHAVSARTDHKLTEVATSVRHKRYYAARSRHFAEQRISARVAEQGKPIISPYLDPKQCVHLTDSQRLRAYTKHRFCIHGRRYNKIKFNGKFYDVTCRHEHEHITNKTVPLYCEECNERTLGEGEKSGFIVEVNCACDAVECNTCAMTWYRYKNDVQNYCCCPGYILPSEKIPDIRKKYKPRQAREVFYNKILQITKQEKLDQLKAYEEEENRKDVEEDSTTTMTPLVYRSYASVSRALKNGGAISSAYKTSKDTIKQIKENILLKVDTFVKEYVLNKFSTESKKRWNDFWNIGILVVLRQAIGDYFNQINVSTFVSLYMAWKSGCWMPVVAELIMFGALFVERLITFIGQDDAKVSQKPQVKDGTTTSTL